MGNTRGLGESSACNMKWHSVVVTDVVWLTRAGFHIKPVSVSIKQTSIEIPITSN